MMLILKKKIYMTNVEVKNNLDISNVVINQKNQKIL
jgi:hypothetical protein